MGYALYALYNSIEHSFTHRRRYANISIEVSIFTVKLMFGSITNICMY